MRHTIYTIDELFYIFKVISLNSPFSLMNYFFPFLFFLCFLCVCVCYVMLRYAYDTIAYPTKSFKNNISRRHWLMLIPLTHNSILRLSVCGVFYVRVCVYIYIHDCEMVNSRIRVFRKELCIFEWMKNFILQIQKMNPIVIDFDLLDDGWIL